MHYPLTVIMFHQDTYNISIAKFSSLYHHNVALIMTIGHCLAFFILQLDHCLPRLIFSRVAHCARRTPKDYTRPEMRQLVKLKPLGRALLSLAGLQSHNNDCCSSRYSYSAVGGVCMRISAIAYVLWAGNPWQTWADENREKVKARQGLGLGQATT
ncbi:hypothetical protein F5Y15DRAFT_381697 [Xylariaceae sp. FL0016]|nr:hypothetical protein F5Y15DRAFT_381697 [Xylariaceae sp. FL0016]